MVRPAGWSGCGSTPTVLPSRRGGSLLKVNLQLVMQKYHHSLTYYVNGLQLIRGDWLLL